MLSANCGDPWCGPHGGGGVVKCAGWSLLGLLHLHLHRGLYARLGTISSLAPVPSSLACDQEQTQIITAPCQPMKTKSPTKTFWSLRIPELQLAVVPLDSRLEKSSCKRIVQNINTNFSLIQAFFSTDIQRNYSQLKFMNS